MLSASLIGPATSIGSLLYARDQGHGSSKKTLHRLVQAIPTLTSDRDVAESEGEEELAWWGHRVVWSRGGEFYRQWTLEQVSAEDEILWAGFVWFPRPETGRDAAPNRQKDMAFSDTTFGPFHSSQHAIWGSSGSSTSSSSSSSSCSSSSSSSGLVRTVTILSTNMGVVYYPSGEVKTFHLPMTVSHAVALPRSQGGVLLERMLRKRRSTSWTESLPDTFAAKRARRSSGVGMVSALADITDIEGVEDLPRLYTILDPLEEAKVVVEARVRDGKIVGSDEPINENASVIFSCSDPYPYPFVIIVDASSSEVVFYQRTIVPIEPTQTAPPPSAAMTPRTMRPEDILKQGTPSVELGIGRMRPSLHRNTSGFSTNGDRHVSSSGAPSGSEMSVDPSDRTRRSFRLSKAAAIDGLPVSSTGDLQAALESQTFPSQKPSNVTTRSKGKARSREFQGGLDRLPSSTGAIGDLGNVRRQSGASSFMREDPDAGKGDAGASLHIIGERELRDTTMLMGIDREDDVVRSEMVLERIWAWKPPEIIDPRTTRVFITDNICSSTTNINIITKSTLHVFRADQPSSNSRWHVFPLKSLPCSSAIPVRSTRSNVIDTLMIADGGLRIVTSDGHDLPLAIPPIAIEKDEPPTKLVQSLSMQLEENDSMATTSPSTVPVGLRNPVRGRFTLVLADGEEIRLSVDFVLKNRLVRQCLESLAWVLDATQVFDLKCRVLMGAQALSAHLRGDSSELWHVFEAAVLDFLGSRRPKSSGSRRRMFLETSCSSSDPIIRRLVAKLAKSSDKPLQPDRIDNESSVNIPGIIIALHLVAQEQRLRSANHRDFSQVGQFLIRLTAAIGQRHWWDYWKRLVPNGTAHLQDSISPRPFPSVFDSPPDILAYLSRRLTTPLKPFPSIRNLTTTHATEFGVVEPCALSAQIIAIYERLGPEPDEINGSALSAGARATACIQFIVDQVLDLDWVLSLTPGVSLPILEMMRLCQAAPVKGLSAKVYSFIGRADLAAQVSPDCAGNNPVPEGPEEIPTIRDIYKSVNESLKIRGQKSSLPYARFGSDRRLQEVERIMQTTRLRTIAVQEPKNARQVLVSTLADLVSDQEIVQYHQGVVNTIANRTLAVPVGQGIFEYGTRTAVITDVWDIPLIELSIKILPAKTTLRAQINAENADWPCFHNGVSAALSISPDCQGVDSSWIVLNRPHNLNPEHGGFLLGLGLTGHLRSLMTYHAFPHLEPRHDFTSVGLLLGLSASYAGSEDLLLTKVLSLHTHALLPLGSMDLNASGIIQSSALVGLGLVYAGRKNLRMAEVALSEIGRRDLPGVEGFGEQQEAYSFSASMAFGLIMLGRGGQASSEVDRRMLSQLQGCITGDSQALDGRKSAIDTTLTAPGATLALGLMYLKTGRQDVADVLEIPNTAFALEHVRPDALLLRTFARALIMWNDIQPSLAWIESQLPSFIKHRDHKKTSQLELNTELAYLNIVSGACLAIGLKYAGTATELAHSNLMFFFSVLSKAASGQSMTYEGNIRRTAARQGLNIVTIALSVVMSGTGELNVLRRLRISHGQEGAGVTYGTHMAMHMACGILFLGRGHYTLGNSNLAIAAMAIAFFPRFSASPGDNNSYPQAFRHLWALAVEPRCLVAKDVNTRETVYLPVKIRMDTGSRAQTQSLISPTLIAPLDTIRSVEVDSPRYWPIVYDLQDPVNKDSLIKTRTIKVKRKAGFLDYNSDSKGNRSIFVKAGSMTGFDLHYDLISPAAPHMIEPDEVLALMIAHSGDPVLITLAKHFCGATQLDAFVRAVLLECVSLDKPIVLTVYLELFNMLTNTSPEVLNQLAMIKSFYAVQEKFYAISAGDRKFSLIRASFIATLERRLTISEVEGSEEYFRQGVWPEDGTGLARWITTHRVPDWPLLEELKTRVGREDGPDVAFRVRVVANNYASSISGQWDIVRVCGRGSRWTSESLAQAVQLWSR
ncbi:hypothetical protein BD324DRAFT_599421 [Kockovaella imperatae]|uniref:Uncharacterized protein n=1 Tax=Kockovaella imperatae TaxID=4999 RepID=A0A1Y1UN28_9TREE|nr:hypothetical protein BD324DRAFT_599421 [Kockovaella imperatae]ORX38535.1 hypothetical protein BD324DRAFT_599421 [Kockovaella imperatae]